MRAAPPATSAPLTDDNPADRQYKGYLDYANSGSLGDWVWNGSYPNRAIVVEVVENGNVLATRTASNGWQDLVNAGKGNGQQDYDWSIPGNLKNG